MNNTHIDTLAAAGCILGLTKERVRQLIREGKLNAINTAEPGARHAKWLISIESINKLKTRRQLAHQQERSIA